MIRNILVLTLFGLLCGCGYHMGGLTTPGIDSVAVPIFKNHTLYRNFEFTLTDALIKEIHIGTALRVTPLDKADSVLSGEIIKIRQSTVTKDESRLATQFDVTITVEIEWKNRNGKILAPRQSVSETMEVFTERGQDFNTAMTLALGKLARSIVYTMENPELLDAYHAK